MFKTCGIPMVSTVTELRQDVSTYLDHVQQTNGSVLVQRNSEPLVILISPERNTTLTQKENIDISEEDS